MVLDTANIYIFFHIVQLFFHFMQVFSVPESVSNNKSRLAAASLTSLLASDKSYPPMGVGFYILLAVAVFIFLTATARARIISSWLLAFDYRHRFRRLL